MNWWKRKQITHVLLLLLCIGLFSCTADPPVGGAEITAPEEYLNVNHYVETALHSDFPDFLPDREALDPSADILRYHYEILLWRVGRSAVRHLYAGRIP